MHGKGKFNVFAFSFFAARLLSRIRRTLNTTYIALGFTW